MSFHDASSPIPGDGQQIHIPPDGMVRFGSDNQTNVHFYKRPVPDAELSRQMGRPMTRGIDYVRIQHPGERDTIDTPVANKPDAPHRWPRQWMLYQKSQEQIPEGTPIEMLFPQSPEIGANLHSYGVHTIEQMAELTEHGAQSIGMGATQWRNQARGFLEKANKGVGIHQMQAALDKRDNEIEVLKNQLAEQRTQIDRLIAAKQGVPETMIPSGPGPIAQAQAAAVAQARAQDWTQAHVHQATHGAPNFPQAAAHEPAPVAPDDFTAGPALQSTLAKALELKSDIDSGMYSPNPANAPPQPSARRRGRPPKSAPAH